MKKKGKKCIGCGKITKYECEICHRPLCKKCADEYDGYFGEYNHICSECLYDLVMSE
jgi:hypothetical protein